MIFIGIKPEVLSYMYVLLQFIMLIFCIQAGYFLVHFLVFYEVKNFHILGVVVCN